MARQSNQKSGKKRLAKSNQMACRLPRNAPPIEVTISHIGGRGDGIAKALYTHDHSEAEHNVFVPGSLPGERLLVQPLSLTSQGIKARIIELYTQSPDRHTPRCDAFSTCGGCQLQHWDKTKIGRWKTCIFVMLVSPIIFPVRLSYDIEIVKELDVIEVIKRQSLHASADFIRVLGGENLEAFDFFLAQKKG